MKKSVYIMSSIEIIVGAVILAICSIVKTTLPVLGRVAYQAAAAGSYSPMSYDTSFSFANTIAVLLIIVGIGQMVLAVIKNNKHIANDKEES